jgi:FdhD protein
MGAFLSTRDITLTVTVDEIARLCGLLESKQNIFRATGSTHAAGIFGLTGNLLASSEDVGRHNALDKAIGLLVAERRLSDARIVVLTSRLSYEMVQKIMRLNAEILIGVSSATSLAIALAEAANITLIGWSRNKEGIIYTCPERILLNST